MVYRSSRLSNKVTLAPFICVFSSFNRFSDLNVGDMSATTMWNSFSTDMTETLKRNNYMFMFFFVCILWKQYIDSCNFCSLRTRIRSKVEHYRLHQLAFQGKYVFRKVLTDSSLYQLLNGSLSSFTLITKKLKRRNLL